MFGLPKETISVFPGHHMKRCHQEGWVPSPRLSLTSQNRSKFCQSIKEPECENVIVSESVICLLALNE